MNRKDPRETHILSDYDTCWRVEGIALWAVAIGYAALALWVILHLGSN